MRIKTSIQFLVAMHGVYGGYLHGEEDQSPDPTKTILGATVLDWLDQQHLDDADFTSLFRECVQTYGTEYRMRPIPKHLMALLERIEARRAQERYNRACRALDPPLITPEQRVLVRQGIHAVNRCLKLKRDPRNDATVKSIVEKMRGPYVVDS